MIRKRFLVLAVATGVGLFAAPLTATAAPANEATTTTVAVQVHYHTWPTISESSLPTTRVSVRARRLTDRSSPIPSTIMPRWATS
ncbi:MAG: hypothetical protein ACRESZ_18955 [Methylococcales bacterium]